VAAFQWSFSHLSIKCNPSYLPQVSYAMTGFVFFGAIIMLVIFRSLRTMIDEDMTKADEESLSPNDYTVFVRGVPGGISAEEIREHFSTRCVINILHAHWVTRLLAQEALVLP
jgi:hypothetical protein